MRWLISLTIISLMTSVLAADPETFRRFRQPLIKFAVKPAILPAVVSDGQVQIQPAVLPAVQSDGVELTVLPDVIGESVAVPVALPEAVPLAVPEIAAASVGVAPTSKRIMPFIGGPQYWPAYGAGLQDWYGYEPVWRGYGGIGGIGGYGGYGGIGGIGGIGSIGGIGGYGGYGGYGSVVPRNWGPRFGSRDGFWSRDGRVGRRVGRRGGRRSGRRGGLRSGRRDRRRVNSDQPKVDVSTSPILVVGTNAPAETIVVSSNDTNAPAVEISAPVESANAGAQPEPVSVDNTKAAVVEISAPVEDVNAAAQPEPVSVDNTNASVVEISAPVEDVNAAAQPEPVSIDNIMTAAEPTPIVVAEIAA